MPTPITWRDLNSPNAGSANSLIAQSGRTFNDAFSGVNNLAALAREQSIRADEERKQALANKVLGDIVNASNPNQLQGINFAGLGEQGANVAGILQQARNDYFKNQGMQASTQGQLNTNRVFDTVTNADLNKINAETAGINAETAGSTIDNLTRGAINNANLQNQLLKNTGLNIGNKDAQARYNADSPYYASNAKLGNESLKYRVGQEKTKNEFLPRQLQSGLDNDISTRALQKNQGYASL